MKFTRFSSGKNTEKSHCICVLSDFLSLLHLAFREVKIHLRFRKSRSYIEDAADWRKKDRTEMEKDMNMQCRERYLHEGLCPFCSCLKMLILVLSVQAASIRKLFSQSVLNRTDTLRILRYVLFGLWYQGREECPGKLGAHR